MINLATEPLMTVDEAERLTTRIGLKLDTLAGSYEAVMPLIHEAVEREVHQILGYPNFTTYAVERFRGQLERLDVDVRRAVVKELDAAGLSQRAIAPIVGISHGQVSKDLHVLPEETPEPELADDALTGDVLDPEPPPESEPVKTGGLDGKEYTKKPRQTKPKQRKEETKPRRKKLPQQVGVAGTNLRTATEKLENLTTDDRFDQYKTELATQLASHLNYTIQACQNILTRIN